MDHAGLQPRGHCRCILPGPVTFFELRERHSGPPLEGWCRACPKICPAPPTAQAGSIRSGPPQLNDEKGHLPKGRWLSSLYPQSQTTRSVLTGISDQMHPARALCRKFLHFLGRASRTLYFASRYDTTHFRTPNLKIMTTYFYPRKHGMSASRPLAELQQTIYRLSGLFF